MSSIHIYWDESHIWGLLVWRALRALGLPHRLLRAREIAQGALSRNPPAALVVPGGTARRKFAALGPEGVAAVRDYVRGGGVYLGFCGGAGLGLTGRDGLGLCPWKRRAFSDRIQHTNSGHIHVRPAQDNALVPPGIGPAPLLPVWWPARFEYEPCEAVRVLAAYTEPGPDFWTADLPLASIPRGPLEDLETQYGLAIWPHYMTGQPCLVEGHYGAGRYVLSYSHLETPASPQANAWLVHLVRELAGLAPAHGGPTPAWNLETLTRRWPDEAGGAALAAAKAGLEASIAQGQDQWLFFRRNAWLFGWRRGIPGGALNALHSLVCQVQNLEPGPGAARLWLARRAEFMERLEQFRHGLAGYLLAERLAMTMSGTINAIPEEVLTGQRLALFGAHMDFGGLFAPLLETMDELFFATVTEAPERQPEREAP
ncbi:BPL-N domain-containing protein [Desulfocurvus sp.]|jgi:hypothetical protein|uniref:BPL-N domain-containing protein n=1 Tax=Desulfocurvus sp. TaxID=2871698 RepID=UPI0025C255BA|nr:BPL-N domain-containing protein [Desulfocurvus sp.]MCK9240672.1 BPL-N domain-containing protein [Desulfocurvus sp.]